MVSHFEHASEKAPRTLSETLNMITDTESAENPYSSSVGCEQPSGTSKIRRWVFLALATMLIFFSLPGAWRTLELVNQEYLHLWNRQRAIYDIEINGAPVSNADAIRFGTANVVIQWGIAGALLIVARFFRTNPSRTND